MPNHCTNHLTVSGDAKEIKRFHEAITAGERQDHEEFRILDNLFPTPQELRETVKGFSANGGQNPENAEKQKVNMEKFGVPDWYEWNCKNYGSKWSDYDGVFGQVSDNEINMVFVSAWSPIGEGIRNVSEQFPTLDFILAYDEGGMAFCGGYAIRNGEIIADLEGEYPSMTVEQSENEEYDEFYEQVSTVVQMIENKCKEALSVSV